MVSFNFQPTDAQDNLIIRLVIIYDDQKSACRVKCMLDQISYKLDGSITFDLKLWRSDMFGLPDLQDELYSDLRSTNYVIVTFRGDGGSVLAPCLSRIIGRWSQECPSREAALMVIPEDIDSCAGTLSRLQDITSEQGVSFAYMPGGFGDPQ